LQVSSHFCTFLDLLRAEGVWSIGPHSCSGGLDQTHN
jgi:hypothetical protein